MNVRSIVSGRGGRSLIITSIFTLGAKVSDERLQQLKKILEARLHDMCSAMRVIGDFETQRQNPNVEIVDGKIVVALQYAHSVGNASLEGRLTFGPSESWAQHDAVTIVSHLKQYIEAFEE